MSGPRRAVTYCADAGTSAGNDAAATVQLPIWPDSTFASSTAPFDTLSHETGRYIGGQALLNQPGQHLTQPPHHRPSQQSQLQTLVESTCAVPAAINAQADSSSLITPPAPMSAAAAAFLQQMKKKRSHISAHAHEVLEATFTTNHAPDPKARAVLAEHLGLTARAVKVWFQNRRKARAAELGNTDDPKIIAELATRIRNESTESNRAKLAAANSHQQGLLGRHLMAGQIAYQLTGKSNDGPTRRADTSRQHVDGQHVHQQNIIQVHNQQQVPAATPQYMEPRTHMTPPMTPSTGFSSSSSQNHFVRNRPAHHGHDVAAMQPTLDGSLPESPNASPDPTGRPFFRVYNSSAHDYNNVSRHRHSISYCDAPPHLALDTVGADDGTHQDSAQAPASSALLCSTYRPNSALVPPRRHSISCGEKRSLIDIECSPTLNTLKRPSFANESADSVGTQNYDIITPLPQWQQGNLQKTEASIVTDLNSSRGYMDLVGAMGPIKEEDGFDDMIDLSMTFDGGMGSPTLLNDLTASVGGQMTRSAGLFSSPTLKYIKHNNNRQQVDADMLKIKQLLDLFPAHPL